MNNENNQILLISVKPKYAEKILNGEKTVELRKSAPTRIKEGGYILIYVTSPVKQILGICQIGRIMKDTPSELWKKVKFNAGVTKSEFNDYFADYKNGYGLILNNVNNLEPIDLDYLKSSISGFNPPQTYRYINTNEIKNKKLKRVLTFV